ncbi:hypothetical protein [Psychrobacillus psychrodurans]|uniref:hypothetical protein n=1 Tax=Psychrobacillus psychrodurans TaxID=126157 RepID=UPI003A4C7DE0
MPGTNNQENLIGTEITRGTFRALEGKKTKTIHRGAYGSFNLLKFHLYENGLIIKEYQLGTSKPIQYEVVNEVEEEFEDGGVRELDGYFEGTKLAFVDYLRPHAIVKKGFKLAFISGAKISKYKGDLSVKKTPTVENKSKGSVNGSKEAGNSNKGKVKIDYDLAKGYIRDVESKTGLKLHKTQIEKLKVTLRENIYEKMTPLETLKHRNKFNSVKNKLIKEWEENTGQNWPRYTEEIYDKKGRLARDIGQPYDAHHIIENNFGGPHEWWNIHPAKFPDEHQAGIHGKGSPSNKLFPRR